MKESRAASSSITFSSDGLDSNLDIVVNMIDDQRERTTVMDCIIVIYHQGRDTGRHDIIPYLETITFSTSSVVCRGSSYLSRISDLYYWVKGEVEVIDRVPKCLSVSGNAFNCCCWICWGLSHLAPPHACDPTQRSVGQQTRTTGNHQRCYSSYLAASSSR